MRNLSNDPPPGVGPYMITNVVAEPVVHASRATRSFAEHRRSRTSRPGHVDTSTSRSSSNTQTEAQQVLNNQADVFDSGDTLPPSLLPQIESKASDRFEQRARSLDVLLLPQHAGEAVQQPAGAPGGQLRDRPRGDGAARRRLPRADAAASCPRAWSATRRAPARTATPTTPGPGQGQAARAAVRHGRAAGHGLGRGAQPAQASTSTTTPTC